MFLSQIFRVCKAMISASIIYILYNILCIYYTHPPTHPPTPMCVYKYTCVYVHRISFSSLQSHAARKVSISPPRTSVGTCIKIPPVCVCVYYIYIYIYIHTHTHTHTHTLVCIYISMHIYWYVYILVNFQSQMS